MTNTRREAAIEALLALEEKTFAMGCPLVHHPDRVDQTFLGPSVRLATTPQPPLTLDYARTHHKNLCQFFNRRSKIVPGQPLPEVFRDTVATHYTTTGHTRYQWADGSAIVARNASQHLGVHADRYAEAADAVRSHPLTEDEKDLYPFLFLPMAYQSPWDHPALAKTLRFYHRKSLVNPISYQHDDGGRRSAGFKQRDTDCYIRAIAILTGAPYMEVYLTAARIMGRFGYTATTQRKKHYRRIPWNEARATYELQKDLARSYSLVRYSLPLKARPTFAEAYAYHGNCIVFSRFYVDKLSYTDHASAIVDGVLHDLTDIRLVYEDTYGTRIAKGERIAYIVETLAR